MAKEQAKAAGRRGVVARGLKPRTKDTYSNEAHGMGDSSLPMNDHTINTRTCKVNLIRPNAKKGPMIFRPWPALDYADPSQLERGRISAKSTGLGHFIRRQAAAVFAGRSDGVCEKHTWLLYDPSATEEEKKNNPYDVLYWKCWRAEDSGKFASGKSWDAEWNKILKGSQKDGGTGADLSRPTGLYFMQGELYANGDKDYLSDRDLPLGAAQNDDLVVVQLSQGAGMNLFKLFSQERKEFDGDEDTNPAIRYRLGDPCGIPQKDGSVKGGWFLHIWHPGKFKAFKPAKPAFSSWNGEITAGKQGYEIYGSKEMPVDGKVIGPSLSVERAEVVKNKWQYWTPSDDGSQQGLLYIPSQDEQCLLVAKCFRTMPGMIQQAWADHPEFFTDDVKAVLRNRTQVVIPNNEPIDEEPAPKPGKTRKDPTVEEIDPDTDEFVDEDAPEDEVEDEVVDDDVEAGTEDEPEDGSEDEPEDGDPAEDAESDEFAEDEPEEGTDEVDDEPAPDEEPDDGDEYPTDEDPSAEFAVDAEAESVDEDAASDDFDPEEEAAAKKVEMSKALNAAKAVKSAAARAAKRPTPTATPPKAVKPVKGKPVAGKKKK